MIETNAHDDYSMHLMTRILGLGTVGHLERPPIHKYTMLSGSRLYFADIGRPTAEIDTSHTCTDMEVYHSAYPHPPRAFSVAISMEVKVKVLEPTAFLLATREGEVLWSTECIKAALEQIALEEAREQLQDTCDNIKVTLESRADNPPPAPYEPTFLSPWRKE